MSLDATIVFDQRNAPDAATAAAATIEDIMAAVATGSAIMVECDGTFFDVTYNKVDGKASARQISG